MSDKQANKARTWNGRYVNIAHRRSPSELTPLIQQNLALQQQVEILTAQNQHILQQQLNAPNLVPAIPQTLLHPPFGHQRHVSASAAHFPSHQRQRSQGHVRRHSLAVSEAKRAAHERVTEFDASPPPKPSSLDQSAEFRFPPRGHSRSQSAASARKLGFPDASRHPRQNSFGFPHSHSHSHSFSNQNQTVSPSQNPNQSSRKSLFVPYLPQSAIPEMLADGLLVTGTLRVNHKNRSYAYVSTDVLDAEVFIAGSKDRNRALEGDLVAVELLDVNDVWDQKREKEERKRRRDADGVSSRLIATAEGQLRRRGSLRQREPQKKRDDVEVEGRTLLLREELGSGDDKPLYAGHVVAVLERPAGQLFSGTLGLLRPSSQASKERHSRSNSAADEFSVSTAQNPLTERPKIVWFKPVDKCVPLMAIPTEQAPADLVENPQTYANQVFVAQIKRWPITSLHPFGMLMERLGSFGDASVSERATLREFNFGPHEFSAEAVAEAVRAGDAMRQTATSRVKVASDVVILAPDLAASIHKVTESGELWLRVHVLDLTPFVERNGALDRELRHKSASVQMQRYASPLIPAAKAAEAVQLALGKLSPVLTIEFGLESSTVRISRQSVQPVRSALVANSTAATYDPQVLHEFAGIVKTLRHKRGLSDQTLDLSALLDVVVPARAPLADLSAEEQIVAELMHAANAGVASELLRSQTIGLGALVRRQSEPPLTRLEELVAQLKRQGVRVDASSASALAQSLASQLSSRQLVAVKARLAKTLSPQRYAVAYRTNPGQLGHYWFGFDAYTHFTRPLLRYSDHLVARQVHAMLDSAAGEPAPLSAPLTGPLGSPRSSSGPLGSPETAEPTAIVEPTADSSSHLVKPAAPRANNHSASLGGDDPFGAVALAPELSFRYDCARGVQEQSFHLALAEQLGERYALHLGVVTAVYESAFDVVVPELSVEKRVHGDQLPLVKAEFHPNTELLELFWKRGGGQNSDVDLEESCRQVAALSLTEPAEYSGSSAGSASTAYSSAGDMSSLPLKDAMPESTGVPEVTDEMRQTLTLRPSELVQEIRPLQDVPVLVRAVSQDRVLPSIVVLAAYPFARD